MEEDFMMQTVDNRFYDQTVDQTDFMMQTVDNSWFYDANSCN